MKTEKLSRSDGSKSFGYDRNFGGKSPAEVVPEQRSQRQLAAAAAAAAVAVWETVITPIVFFGQLKRQQVENSR